MKRRWPKIVSLIGGFTKVKLAPDTFTRTVALAVGNSSHRFAGLISPRSARALAAHLTRAAAAAERSKR